MSSVFVIGLPKGEKMSMEQKNTFLMCENIKFGERHKLINSTSKVNPQFNKFQED